MNADELDATKQQLQTTLHELNTYEQKLREMGSTFSSLRYRANSNIPLSAEELVNWAKLRPILR